MPLVIETGSCVTGADSFVSLVDANTHFTNYGGFWTGTDPEKEAALRRAADYLSSIRWYGARTCPNAALSWPRTGMSDCDGNAIDDNAIPYSVIRAQLALAAYELRYPFGLTPTVTAGKQVLKEKVDVIEVTYMTAEQQGLVAPIDPIAAQRPILTQVNDLLRCFASLGRAAPWPFVV